MTLKELLDSLESIIGRIDLMLTDESVISVVGEHKQIMDNLNDLAGNIQTEIDEGNEIEAVEEKETQDDKD